MSSAEAAAAFDVWTTPECPFAIQYATHVLDDIRVAVVDAFCSVRRGGVEIGGRLLGEWKSGRLLITGFAPLECEHRHGPSFTLSENDEARLRELLEQSADSVVGWYHSHTRSE